MRRPIGRNREFSYEEARRLHGEGVTVRALALRYGVSSRTIRYVVHEPPGSGRKFDYEEAARLRKQGLSWGQLARHFDVHPTTVQKALKRHGLA